MTFVMSKVPNFKLYETTQILKISCMSDSSSTSATKAPGHSRHPDQSSNKTLGFKPAESWLLMWAHPQDVLLNPC